MTLGSLSVTNFKNIAQAHLEFSQKFNCLLGDNGMGKSNLLDAIYFLSFCKSFTGAQDSMLLLRHGQDTEPFAMVQGEYVRRDAPETLIAALQPGRRKSLKRCGKEYKKLSEHIGKFPAVLISPADMDLVNGSGEERRRLMDMVISQTDPLYLDALIRYGRALEQRNRMLKDGMADPNLYMAVEMAMEGAAATICGARRKWTGELEALFQRYYTAIGADGETPRLRYASHMAEPGISLASLLDERRERDAALKYTSAGPHRDDIEMSLSGLPLRRCASQGQAKSYTIALRMAQYEFLRQATGIKPLLLLDDIFDKLDASRMERIMALMASPEIGQIFITDTDRKNLDEILSRSAGDYALFTVSNGSFSRQNHGS